MKQCPDEERLTDYLEGRLDAPDRREIESHLAQCADCLDLVVPLLRSEGPEPVDTPEPVTAAAIRAVEGFARRPPVRPVSAAGRSHAPSLGERLRTWLAGFAPSPEPLAAGIRGAGGTEANRTVTVLRRFGDLSVVIDLEETGAGQARMRVRPEADAEANAVRVTLVRDGREEASLVLESGGGTGVVFDPVRSGRGRLVFTRAGEEIGVYGFDLRA